MELLWQYFYFYKLQAVTRDFSSLLSGSKILVKSVWNTANMITAPVTSSTECCFRNIVARIIDAESIRQTVLTQKFRAILPCERNTENSIARVLKTWMLGITFVGVSVL